jgi:hypothetical protein
VTDLPQPMTAGRLAELQEHAERPSQYTARTLRLDYADMLAEITRLRAEHDELLTELDGRDEEARERWIDKTLNETGIKAMDFRNGMSMELEPAREMVAHWVGAARGMLGDAENYSETPVEMEVKVGESPERFVFTLQRAGKLTPHQARQKAEQERDDALARLAQYETAPTEES